MDGKEMTNTMKILPFDVKQASQAQYTALNRHINRIRTERLPDDPPIPLEETIQGLIHLPPFIEIKMWGIWDPAGNDILALGNAALVRLEENKHLAQFEISVVPEHRLKGLGRRLLVWIADSAQADNRRLLMTETTDRIPGGEAFMMRLGAQKGLEAHVNQLRLDALDRNLVKRWLDRGQVLAAGFELGVWDGPYPDEQLSEIVSLYDLTNQQPHGDLDIEDIHITPEQIRQVEEQLFTRGNQRWTYYATEKQTGKFAGYTETVWNPNRPEILRQDMTGVFPEYRGRGLGRWLKAAMLDKVLKERPEVKVVRTGNADTNAAMLKINHELGFKPYMATALWQIEVERVQGYLNEGNREGTNA
jgi:mycothiol synthase